MLSKHTWLLIASIVVLVVVSLAWLPAVQRGQTDTPHYERIAQEVLIWRSGASSGIHSEYPPLITAVFAIINTIAEQLDITFLTAWLITLGVVLIAAVLYAAWRLTPADPWLIIASVALCGLLLGGTLVLGRYDILVALLLLLCWRSLASHRYMDSGLWLLLAAGLKLVPLCLLPLLLLHTPRPQRRRILVGASLGVLLALAIPLIAIGPRGILTNTHHMLAYHGERGVGIESLWSTTSMLLHSSQGLRSSIDFHHGAFHNADLPPFVPTLAAAIMGAGLVGIYITAWRRARTHKNSFLWSMLTILLWVLAISPLLSPQYLLWVIVPMFAWVAERAASGSFSPLALIAVALALSTQWVYPWHFGELWYQQSLPLVVLVHIRNVALVALACFLYLAQVDKKIAQGSKKLPGKLEAEDAPGHRQHHNLQVLELNWNTVYSKKED